MQKNGLGKKPHAFSISALGLRPYLMQKCLSADRGAKLTSKYGTLPPSDVRSDYAFMLQSSRLVLGQLVASISAIYERNSVHIWSGIFSGHTTGFGGF